MIMINMWRTETPVEGGRPVHAEDFCIVTRLRGGVEDIWVAVMRPEEENGR